jgi:hypothetical protein
MLSSPGRPVTFFSADWAPDELRQKMCLLLESGDHRSNQIALVRGKHREETGIKGDEEKKINNG